MSVEAPRLETVESIMDGYSLPLLVQQRAGDRLLLHKSIIIPYVICQPLSDSVDSDNEYFLIPLSNKGYYGAVSPHDQPTKPYHCIAQMLESESIPDPADVLIDSVTPIRCFDRASNKFIDKVLLPEEMIPLSKHKSCPHLVNSNKGSLCCFSSKPAATEHNTVCVRDNSRHLHIDKYLESRYYVVNKGSIQSMPPGTVSLIQDIAQHQGLPRIVCSVSVKQTPRDELPLPKLFRLIKIISDKVILGYRLSDSNHPRPDDVLELSSYSQEMLAIADSCRVNMDDIKNHHVNMSVRRAHPGKTLSHKDFHDIVRKSQTLPPKLPERPQTLRLKSNSVPTSAYSNMNGATDRDIVTVDSYSLSPPVQYTQVNGGATTPNRLDLTGSTTPDLKSSQTVRLPTRDTSNRSLLKRFSTISVRRRDKHPSMKDILNNFHKKEDENNNNNKRKSKKSLRGLEIVHVLPDAQHSEVIDLTRPLSAQNTEGITPCTISSSSSVTSHDHSLPSHDTNHLDEFIHSHYDFLEDQDSSSPNQGSSSHNQEDSSHYISNSSHSQSGEIHYQIHSSNGQESSPHYRVGSTYSSPPSDNSVTKESVNSGRPTVRFSDITLSESYNGRPEPSRSELSDSPSSRLPSSNSQINSQSDSSATIEVPAPDYDDQSTGATVVKQKPVSHLDEIRQRFSVGGNSGLKTTPNLSKIKPTASEAEPMPASAQEAANKSPQRLKFPNDPIEELKMRLSTGSLKPLATSSRDFSKPPTNTSLFSGNRKPQHGNRAITNSVPASSSSKSNDDTYMRPVRPSATIQLTE